MHYTFVRMRVTYRADFREPYLQLPGKAVDVLDGYFKALHPRYTIDLKDLQSSGGTSFGDVKVAVNALAGRARVELTPAAMVVDFQNVTREPDDAATVRDFMVIAEGTLGAKLPGVVIQQRVIRAAAWLKLEEGGEAAERFLRERGDAALKLNEGRYKDWSSQYTLEAELNDQKGKRLVVLFQRSGYPDESDLFVRGDYVVTDRGEGLKPFNEEFDGAFDEFGELLKHVGLKMKVE
jgi:hypothetical protein